jgi:two-component system LytT family response regulator/two-component system response regulator LytT
MRKSGSASGSISTIVADDEQLARDELTFLLEQFEDIEVIATASNGLEAFDLIEKLEPDLAFLDIQMPGLDGLGVVRKLRETQIEAPHIIFSTAWDQFAVEAFRLDVMDYVLKPVEKDRLAESLGRARKALGERVPEAAPSETAPRSLPATRMVVRSGTRNLVIDPQDLIYATISGGVITLVAHGAEGQCNFRTLEELQVALNPDVFWRAHRSWLVNLNKIREVTPWFKSTYQLKMDDKKSTEIPVSRTQSRRLREMLNL